MGKMYFCNEMPVFLHGNRQKSSKTWCSVLNEIRFMKKVFIASNRSLIQSEQQSPTDIK